MAENQTTENIEIINKEQNIELGLEFNDENKIDFNEVGTNKEFTELDQIEPANENVTEEANPELTPSGLENENIKMPRQELKDESLINRVDTKNCEVENFQSEHEANSIEELSGSIFTEEGHGLNTENVSSDIIQEDKADIIPPENSSELIEGDQKELELSTKNQLSEELSTEEDSHHHHSDALKEDNLDSELLERVEETADLLAENKETDLVDDIQDNNLLSENKEKEEEDESNNDLKGECKEDDEKESDMGRVEGERGDIMEEDRDKLGEVEQMSEEEKEINFQILVVSQHQQKVLTIIPGLNVNQLKAIVAVKFNILIDQVLLILNGRILPDDEILEELGVQDGTTFHLLVKYNFNLNQGEVIESQTESILNEIPGFETGQNTEQIGGPTSEFYRSWFGPSQYSRLGLANVDFVQLQQQMQKQMMSNPDMVKELMNNGLVQQLMSNPKVMKQMIEQVPQTRAMLEKNPDIADMLNNEDIMKQTLEIAQNPAILQDMLDKIDRKEHPLDMNLPKPDFGSGPLPTPQTMLHMMTQNPQMLNQMLSAPYLPAMMEGMAANPDWTKHMIVNNPLFANSPQLQKQIADLMPLYLKQMQNPMTCAMMKNPKALKAMLKIQRGVSVLQAEAPNLVQSLGLPNLSMPPPSLVSSTQPGSGDGSKAAGTVDGSSIKASEQKPMHRSQLDPMTVMMTQLINQMGTDKIALPVEEKYSSELELMDTMGFTDRDKNLELLIQTFGNIDTAVMQLLQCEQ